MKLPAVCTRCHAANQTSRRKCRIVLAHMEPPAIFTAQEREEFARAAQVILRKYQEQEEEQEQVAKMQEKAMAKTLAGQSAASSTGGGQTAAGVTVGGMSLGMGGQQNQNPHHLLLTAQGCGDEFPMPFPHPVGSVTGPGMGMGVMPSVTTTTPGSKGSAAGNVAGGATGSGGASGGGAAGKDKRLYRRWTTDERHTVCLGIYLNGGSSFAAIADMLTDRSRGQVRLLTSNCVH